MAAVEESIDVAVPVSTAYNQWTQFESFPHFMNGVESITQTSDTTSHWVTKVGGVERSFDTEITEQHPDERVAWKSVDGTSHAGVVTFHRLNDTNCRLTVQLEWNPETFVEKVGSAVGADKRQVKSSLGRFKEFIENRHSETGAWRGNVEPPSSAGTSGATGAGPTAGPSGDDLVAGTGRAGGLDGTAGGLGGPAAPPPEAGDASAADQPLANPATEDPDSGTAKSG